MKKIILSTLMTVLTVLGLGGVALLSPVNASAADSGLNNTTDYISKSNNGNETNVWETVKTGINVVLGVIGVITVVMIILGGINYATSQGDAAKVKKAMNTILYGVVGLVVALLAFAIVNFVLQNVFGSSIK